MRRLPSAALFAAFAFVGAGTLVPFSAGCGDLILPGAPEAGAGNDAGVGADAAALDDAGNVVDSPVSDDAPLGPGMLLISEVRTHGSGGDGYGDDFIELYNPGTDPVTVDASWKVLQETAQGAGCQGAPVTMFVGAGQVVPGHGHLLMGGWEYTQQPPADVPLMNSTQNASLADAGSFWILHGTKVVDALCAYYDATTKGYLAMMCTYPYQCMGTPANNLPHDGSSGATSAVDASLERLPGGAAGNGQNTGDNAADFHVIMPANPQNTHSPPTP